MRTGSPHQQTGGATIAGLTKQARTRRRCVFCGFEGKMTGEHVWPDWLNRSVFQNAASVIHAMEATGSPRREYRRAAFNDKVMQVCGDCNGGWMSRQLEGRVRPFAEPMIRGEPCSMTEADERAVAAWLLKNAMMFQLSGPSRLHDVIPQHHFGELYRTRETPTPPASVVVWAGLIEIDLSKSPVQFEHFAIQVFLDFIGANSPAGKLTRRNAYVITITMGRLLFQVIGVDANDILLPDMFLDPGQLEPYLARLWPVTRGGIDWPPFRHFVTAPPGPQFEPFATRFGTPHRN